MSFESFLRRLVDEQLPQLVSGLSVAIDQVFVVVEKYADPALSTVSVAIDSALALSQTHVEPLLDGATGGIGKVASTARGAVAFAEFAVKDLSAPAPAPSFIIEVFPKLIDAKYQRFMRDSFDPLFGRARSQQLIDVSAGGQLAISEHEKALNRRIGFTALALVAMTVSVLFAPVLLWVVVPLSFTLTFTVFQRAYDSLVKEKRVNFHVLSAINAVGIWLGGFFIPAVVSTFLYFLGEKLLMITQERSHHGLIDVFSQHPRSVWVLLNGIEVEVPLKQLERGQLVVVSAGQIVPVDGMVLEGVASVNQQMLTGEAQPAERGRGEAVYASTVLLSGRIVVEVDKTGDETVAARIGAILNRTASYQMSLQTKGSALAHASALPTLVAGGVAWATLGLESGLAILNSAFGITIRITAPIAMLNFLNIAARHSILVKDGRSMELLKGVDTVVFDKTGTLTLEEPNVAEVHCCGGWQPEAVLRYAAAAERRQPHPIAKAILAEAGRRRLELPVIDDARYEVGYGISVREAGHAIQVGSDRYMAMEEIRIPPEIHDIQARCGVQGHSLVMVAIDRQLAGAIELQPTIRPEAREVISSLHGRNLKLVIISGDQEEPTRRLAGELGIGRYFANTLPEHKARLVEQLQKEGGSVCFVGDGINDSIALKKANVSISLRGATTVAIDTAQVVLMDESLRQLPFFFQLADEFDSTLKAGFATAIIPGAINVGGVFFLGWGLYKAILVYNLGLAASLAIAMSPLFLHRQPQVLLAPPAPAPEGTPASTPPVAAPPLEDALV